MNCANHPDIPVAAYCQFCGKPLCAQCIHKVGNIVACEPCLAARIGAAAPALSATPAEPGFGTEPWLAFCLGWIPGVGAMYNGQFAKALVHVFVFAILVSLSNQYNGAFGIIVAAWVFYQVFDAYQTTVARRDGLPLPNPLGLNDAGQWFGVKNSAPNPAQPIPQSPPTPPGTAAAYVASPMPSVPPDQVDYPELRRGIPTGAVVLIVIGVAFLLGNMGILSEFWLERGWPLVLIGIGVWLVIRRTQAPPSGGVR